MAPRLWYGGAEIRTESRPAFQLLLSGPPGVGKSTTGAELAAQLGLPLYDLDERIREHTGRSASELLRERGEPEFRRVELEVLQALPRTPGVVALGGGTLGRSEARREARSRGLLFGLTASPETLLRRLEGDEVERPLLSDDVFGLSLRDRLDELLQRRASAYRSVDFSVSAEDEPELVSESISRLQRRMRLRGCAMGGRSSRILLGEDLHRALLGAVENLSPSRPVVVLSDQGIPSAVRESYLGPLSAHFDVWHQPLPGGEICKTWRMLEEVSEGALAAGAGRQSVVVALGGGAVLDLAGLVAALLGRGAPLVLVPSTVLAQVDASVGGKCAINTRGGRNLVGTFHPAVEVLIDTGLLSSLSEEEYNSGLVEVLKMGLIADAALFRAVVKDRRADVAIIDRAVELKAQLVERDPWERGDRMLLNLGHTLGHALEAASDYTLRHGEAVAQGIAAVAELSVRLAGLPRSEADEIQEGISPFVPRSSSLAGLGARALSHIRRDKKGDKDGVELIVLPKIGEAARRRVSWTEVEGAWMPFGGSSK